MTTTAQDCHSTIELAARQSPPADAAERWDGKSVHELRGTYGEYLLSKVSKVFPELRDAVL